MKIVIENPDKKSFTDIGFICDSCEVLIDKRVEARTDDFNIKYGFGYGTEYDGLVVDYDICDNCLGKMLMQFVPKLEKQFNEQ